MADAPKSQHVPTFVDRERTMINSAPGVFVPVDPGNRHYQELCARKAQVLTMDGLVRAVMTGKQEPADIITLGASPAKSGA